MPGTGRLSSLGACITYSFAHLAEQTGGCSRPSACSTASPTRTS